jgi:hypothetical protein
MDCSTRCPFSASKPTRKNLRDAVVTTTQTAAELGSAALDRIAPAIALAAEAVGPYADEALVKAKAAKAKAAGWAAERVEQLEPTLYSALERVTPAVDRAQQALQAEVIPNLVDALHVAAGQPVREPTVVVAVQRRSVGRTILRLLLAGAVLAATAFVVKTWLGRSKSDAWSVHEPRQAYVYPDDTSADASPQVGDYETDSYIGAEPPEGFTIKANARSKKYHLPGMRNYDRTIAEVWFASEEAALGAGFTKAES